MNNCEGCKQPYDFENHAFAWCKTCGKHHLCIHCYDIHECIPGKSRHMLIITNPKCHPKNDIMPEVIKILSQ